MKKHFFATYLIFSIVFSMLVFSCSSKNSAENQELEKQRQLETFLLDKNVSPERLYAIINQISTKMLEEGKLQDLVVYLTDYVERNPDSKYNGYWLLMCAYSYIQMHQEPVAEYYFERILRGCPDLMVKGQSIHYICLEQLIQISTNHENRINYFNMLMSRFPENVNATEMYVRLANEYEKMGDWTRALKMYSMFLAQTDASSVQIVDMNDVYNHARSLINFNNSPKNWMFKTLDGLANAVKEAITYNQPRRLDQIHSRVNFFAISRRQEENNATTEVEFSIQDYMHGNRIRFSDDLIPGSTINEAYLKTTGWTTGASDWYFYFRKVNFPADPKIHGTWEWAGIYMGELF